MENPNQEPNMETIPFYQPQTSTPPEYMDMHVDAPQVIEKIIYKQPKIHGFFRTLTIIALLVVGVLMLLENTGVLKLSIAHFNLNLLYSIFIIFSTIVIRSYKGLFGKIFGLILFLGVVGGFFGISVYTSLNPSTKSSVAEFIHYPAPGAGITGIALSQVSLNTLVGNFVVKGKDTSNLLEGTYTSDRNLVIISGVKTNYDYLSLKEDPNRNLLQHYSTDLSAGISTQKIVNLYLKNLLGIHTIDLTDIQWFKTQIYGGIQDLTVTLGTHTFADSALDIQLVGGKITLLVPKTIGVKLNFSQLAGSIELTDFDIKDKNYFESKNIKTAMKTITINIKAGFSTFKLLWK